MLATLAATDPTAATAFDWAKAVGGLGGSAMLALGTYAWFKGWIVTAATLRHEQEGRAQDRLDSQSIIATKDLQLAAKDDAIEKRDAKFESFTQTLVDDTVPALVKATVVMEQQQAELKARRTR